METKIKKPQQQSTVLGKVDPRDLNERTFYYYCTMYLTENIHAVIPVTSNLSYGTIAKLIASIDPELFDNLHIETNKIILLNQIYTAFMMASEEQISREFLYTLMCHIASYDPSQYEDEKEEEDIPDVRINYPSQNQRTFIV